MYRGDIDYFLFNFFDESRKKICFFCRTRTKDLHLFCALRYFSIVIRKASVQQTSTTMEAPLLANRTAFYLRMPTILFSEIHITIFFL